MEKVFEIYMKTTPERLWQAITDPDLRRKYNFGMRASVGLHPRFPIPRAVGPEGDDFRGRES